MRPREWHVPVDGARLFCREIGTGQPVVVLHGGPDFDHAYLLPELDRLADTCRLVYYDQRGRGRSAAGVRPADVGIDSELADLDAVRRQLGLEQTALLGHSWGGVLALAYAALQPERVSQLILLDTAPASHADHVTTRQDMLVRRPPEEVERMRVLTASAAWELGDLEVEAEYYRLHFGLTVRRRDLLEEIVGRLRTHFSPATVLTARAIEHRLYEQTWLLPAWDLVPHLRAADVPTLVVHGKDDFIPVSVAARIAEALPHARLVVLAGCGHFAHAEAPDLVHEHVAAFLAGA